jgi:hypothetical protein
MTMEDKEVKERNLDYFMGLNYAVLMKKVNDGYCAFIPELSLFAEGQTTSEAYENLEQDKLKYFRRVLVADAGSIVKEPLATTVRRRFFDDLLLFGAKAFVVGVIFGIVMLILVPSIDVFINTRASRVAPLLAAGMVDQIASMVEQFDDRVSHMSEAQLVETKDKLRQTVLRMKPLTDEFKILFEDDKGVGGKPLAPKRSAENSPNKSDK